jgi:hypothetical protein
VTEAVLGDLPPADEQASHRITEARLLYSEWIAFWNRHESFAQSQVRAGWVNTVGLDTGRGRTTRINRLSLDGVTDVTNDPTWFDDVVAQLFNVTNLPMAFMPGGEDYEGQEQETIRYLVISDTADYWPVQNNQQSEENKEEDGEQDAEMADGGGRPNNSEENNASSASRLLVRPSVPDSAPM